jgi:Co/Zn/Cd efflux system component
MDWLIWPGAGVALLGVIGLVVCVVSAVRLRKSGLDDVQMKARLQRLVALNLASVAISAIGLMMVVMGILLG